MGGAYQLFWHAPLAQSVRDFEYVAGSQAATTFDFSLA